MSDVLVEDIFDIKAVDPDGKMFDLVSRAFAISESFKLDLILDINTQLYPVDQGEKFRLVICTETKDQTTDEILPQKGKADQFEYVMFGRIYRIASEPSAESNNKEEKSNKVSVYVSFGGLLMRLTGEANHLQGFDLDNNVYLMLKKLAF